MAETRDLYQWWRSQHSFFYWCLNPFKSDSFYQFDHFFTETLSSSQNKTPFYQSFSSGHFDGKDEATAKTSLDDLEQSAKIFLESELREIMRVKFSQAEGRVYHHRMLQKYEAIQQRLADLVTLGYALDKVFSLYCLLENLCSQEELNCRQIKTGMSSKKDILLVQITRYYAMPLLFNTEVAASPKVTQCLNDYFYKDSKLSTALDNVLKDYHKKLEEPIKQCQQLRAKLSEDKIALVKKLSAIRKDWRQQSYRTFFKRTSLTRSIDTVLDALVQTLTESTVKQSEFDLSDNLDCVLLKITDWRKKRKKKTGFFNVNCCSWFSSQGEKKSCRYDDVITLDTNLKEMALPR